MRTRSRRPAAQAGHQHRADPHPHDRHARPSRWRRVRRAAAGLHARVGAAHGRGPAPGDPRLPVRLAGPHHERRRVDRPCGDQRACRHACDGDERRRRRVLFGQGFRPQPRADLQAGSRTGAHARDAVGLAHQPCVRGGPAGAARADDRADPRGRRQAQALRAAAADAGRERGARPAVRVHPGRRALQPDAGRGPLGRAAGLLAPRAPAQRARHARTVHAVDQHLGHDAERRAVPRLRARRDGGCQT